MFILMLISAVVITAAGIYWMSGRWLSFYGIQSKRAEIRFLRFLVAVVFLICCKEWGMAGLIGIHLVVLFALTELLACFIRKVEKRYDSVKDWVFLRTIYKTGLIPVVGTAALLLFGAYQMGNIVRTEYTIASEKIKNEYNLVLITDTHCGTIQEMDVLRQTVREINERKPDLVILGGDIVEDGTTKEGLEEGFQVLGNLKSTYGTFYVYGNHDRQHYSPQPYYTESELRDTIEKNGIIVLEDSSVLLGNELVLAGRGDVGDPRGRCSTEELLNDVDKGRFLIVADHQPVGMKENDAQGVDLQVSGHTHGGQIFPIGCITALTGGLNYGLYREGNCNVIVSSGLAGWGFPVRTQGKCEYVEIHLRSEN